MIRALRALAWMRFRLFINSMKRTGRRDTLEQISLAIAGVLPLVMAIALVPTALALAVLGFHAGTLFAGDSSTSSWWYAGTRIALSAITLTVILLPLMRGAGGRDAGMTRLRVLPIPRRVLLYSEIVSGFGDPWLGLAIPFLLALPAGLLAGGAPMAALTALAAAGALLLTLGAINACSALGMTLIFRNRKRGEWLTIVGACLAFLIPAVVTGIDSDRDGDGRSGIRIELSAATPDEQVDRLLPGVAAALPGELYVGAIKGSLPVDAGPGRRGAVGVIGLLAWGALTTFGAGRLFRRLLESPGGSSRRSVSRKSAGRVRRYPGLSHPASAVALATVRSTLRTVRGKIAMYLNVAALGVMLAVFLSRPELRLSDDSPLDVGTIAALAGIFFSAVSMHPVMLNLFANDRAGLTRQLLAPISHRDLVLGKLAAGTAMIAVSTALCAALAFAMSPGGSVVAWLALVLVFVSSNLLMGPLSVLLSTIFPKRSDLSRLGKAGNPHGLAGLIGFLLVPVTMAPAALATAIALYGLQRPVLALALPALWTLIAAAIALPLFRMSVASVRRRSDNLMLVATGR